MAGELQASLDLDWGDAISGADQLADAIEQAMAEGAAAGIATVSSELGGVSAEAVEIPVEADVATAQAEISGLEADQVEVPVDADTATAQGEISGLEGEPVEIPVGADTTGAQAEIDSVTGEPIVLEVDADTGNAQAEIAGVGDEAGGAAENLSKVGEAGGEAGGGLAAAGEGAGLAAAGVSKVGGASLGAAAGIGAATFGFHELFSAGVTAATGTERLAQAAGSLAGAVQKVQVGNLNTTLGELGHQFGSTAAEMDGAAAKAIQFATAGGYSARQSVTFAQGVAALSARAVALNPSLGSVADVADQMSTSFGRVILAAKKYNLSLSTAEVAQRAMAITGKTATNQLTIQDKAFAAVQISSERYGDTLAQKIAAGSELAANKQKSLIATGKEVAEVLGRPLAEGTIAGLSQLQGPVEALVKGFSALPGPIQQAAAAMIAFGVISKVAGLNVGEGLLRTISGTGGLAGSLPLIVGAAGVAGLAIGAMGVESGNTAQAIIGMAVAGAAFGTLVLPGIGTAVGAAGGALVGFVASLHGSSDELDATEKATIRLNRAVTSGSVPAIILATDAVQRATTAHGAFKGAIDAADRATGPFVSTLAPKLSQSYEAVKIEGEAFQKALEKSPAAALTTISAYDRLGISTELYRDKLTASVAASQLAQQAQAQLGAAASPLKVTFEDASTAVGGFTARQYEVAGAGSQALDSLSKLGPAQEKFTQALSAGNAEGIESAANARATAVAQNAYNSTLLATGSATQAATAASGSFRATLGELLTSIPVDNPAHAAIEQIIAQMDNLTAHPATIDLKVDGGQAALQLATINHAIDDIIKHPKQDPIKIFMDDTEATAKLDGINQARKILSADPTKFQVVMEDLATGNIDHLNQLLNGIDPVKNITLAAGVTGGDVVGQLKDKIDHLDDKTITAIANVLGITDVEQLKSTVNQLTPKQVDAVARAIGKGDVDQLAGAVAGLTPKQVDAIVNTFGEGSVRSLTAAVSGLSPKQVDAIANAIGEHDVHALDGAVQGLSPKTVDAIAHAFGYEDLASLRAAIASVQGKDVVIRAVVSGVAEAKNILNSLGAASGATVPYGGEFASGGTAVMVGERGPELAVLPGGTQIINNPRTRARMQRADQESGGSVFVDASHLDAAADRMIAAAELLIAVTGLGTPPSRRILQTRG